MGWIFIDLTRLSKTINEPFIFPLYHTHLKLYISLDGISGTYFLPWVLFHVIRVRGGYTVSRLGKLYWILSYCEGWLGFLVWYNLLTLVYDMVCLLGCCGSVSPKCILMIWAHIDDDIPWWRGPSYHDDDDYTLLRWLFRIFSCFDDDLNHYRGRWSSVVPLCPFERAWHPRDGIVHSWWMLSLFLMMMNAMMIENPFGGVMTPSSLMMSCPRFMVFHLWWNISLDYTVRLLCIQPSMMRRHLTPLMMRCSFWTIRHDIWWDVAPFHGETWHIEHYTPLWRMKSCLFHSLIHMCDSWREFMI